MKDIIRTKYMFVLLLILLFNNLFSQSKKIILKDFNLEVEMKYLSTHTSYSDTVNGCIFNIKYYKVDNKIKIIKFSLEGQILEVGEYVISKLLKGSMAVENPTTGELLITPILYYDGIRNGYWFSFNEKKVLLKMEEWNLGKLVTDVHTK